MASQELVLLYQLDESTEKGSKIHAVLSTLEIPFKTIQHWEVGETIGYLAGLPGFAAASKQEPATVIEDEVLLMKDLPDSRIDRILTDFRDQGVGRIALKAVVTPNNQSWTLQALVEELRADHQIMSRYHLLHQAVQVGNRRLSESGGQNSELTAAVEAGQALLGAREAPELAILDTVLARLKQALDAPRN
jgi:hypothetical protein